MASYTALLVEPLPATMWMSETKRLWLECVRMLTPKLAKQQPNKLLPKLCCVRFHTLSLVLSALGRLTSQAVNLSSTVLLISFLDCLFLPGALSASPLTDQLPVLDLYYML